MLQVPTFWLRLSQLKMSQAHILTLVPGNRNRNRSAREGVAELRSSMPIPKYPRPLRLTYAMKDALFGGSSSTQSRHNPNQQADQNAASVQQLQHWLGHGCTNNHHSATEHDGTMVSRNGLLLRNEGFPWPRHEQAGHSCVLRAAHIALL
jgi:hypothetical protein